MVSGKWYVVSGKWYVLSCKWQELASKREVVKCNVVRKTHKHKVLFCNLITKLPEVNWALHVSCCVFKAFTFYCMFKFTPTSHPRFSLYWLRPLAPNWQALKLAPILPPYHSADLTMQEYLHNFIHERRQKFHKLTFTPMDNPALWNSTVGGEIGLTFQRVLVITIDLISIIYNLNVSCKYYSNHKYE